MSKHNNGLVSKYIVLRVDEKDNTGIPYFVLNYTTDHHARAALSAYAESCHKSNPELASDLRRILIDLQKNI